MPTDLNNLTPPQGDDAPEQHPMAKIFDPFPQPPFSPSLGEAAAEIGADKTKRLEREELMDRAASIASSPGFDWTRIPVTRPSQKAAKARKSKARAQRNARKHNRKRK